MSCAAERDWESNSSAAACVDTFIQKRLISDYLKIPAPTVADLGPTMWKDAAIRRLYRNAGGGAVYLRGTGVESGYSRHLSSTGAPFTWLTLGTPDTIGVHSFFLSSYLSSAPILWEDSVIPGNQSIFIATVSAEVSVF